MVLFEYRKETDEQIKTKKLTSLFTPHEGTVKTGIIGPGKFASSFLIPHIIDDAHYDIIAVAAKQPQHAQSSAEKYKAKYSTTNYMEILEDSDIDAVFIATRHDTHAKFTIDALEHGKEHGQDFRSGS